MSTQVLPWVLASEDNLREHYTRTDAEGGVTFPSRFYVVAHAVDRFYGGPEEGGWWYDAGRVIHVSYVPVMTTDRAQLLDELRDEFTRVEARLRPRFGEDDRGHVYGGPDLSVSVTDEWPQDFPAERPHYE